MRHQTLMTALLLCGTLVAPPGLQGSLAQSATLSAGRPNARVVVKYKADSALLRKTVQSASALADRATRTAALATRLGIPLSAGADIADRTQVVLASGMSSEDLAARLSAESDIEYAVVDGRKRSRGVPNDPLYATRVYNNPTSPTSGGPLVGQWYLKPPGPAGTAANTAPASINAEQAWDLTTGSANVVVGVVDTGVRFDHTDFRTVANGGNLLPGYDMIVNDATSADGQPGRDADASDPGDGVTSADISAGVPGCTTGDIGPSSWHGTETAGLIGALTDNAIGVASVGRNIRVLPVRALGKCGGYDSDIVAAMRWAAGLAVPGVPTNTNKAAVINLSLGGTGTCNSLYSDAIGEITAAGSVIVVAAGNSNGHAVGEPANCSGVIAVAGLRHVGTKVGFSDIGPQIALAAPGGNCVNTAAGAPCLYPIMSTSNSGTTTPVGGAAGSIYTDSFNASLGTSFSSPLVSATAGLMLSVNPTLTPAQVKAELQSTARAFPTSGGDNGTQTAVTTCTAPTSADQLQCYCTTQTCGAGMLDTRAAVAAANASVQARITVGTAAPTAGQLVTLSAADSVVPSGRSIASYRWVLVDAGTAGAALIGDTAASTVSVQTSAAGTFTVSLTTTDDAGVASTATTMVTVAAASVVTSPTTPTGTPSSGSSGGGGAIGIGWLLLLSMAVLALRAVARRERRRSQVSAPDRQPGMR